MSERKTIYLCLAHMSEEGWEQKYVKEAFDTNWVVPMGPNVNEFEKSLEEFVNDVRCQKAPRIKSAPLCYSIKEDVRCAPLDREVVCLSAGTAAVHLALIACGVKAGDEVLVQSYTFCASSHPITYLGADDSHSVEVMGEKVYLPSPNLHALFLAKHMASHFTGANITLRQVLDWAFFIEKHSSQIDWEWLNRMLTDFHLKDFMNSINAICVDELGFDAKIFPSVQFNPEIKKRVFNDIIHPEFEAASPKLLIPRLIYKYRRWQGNAWKQRLCFNESRWSAFWGGIWAKILKPKSI